MTAFLADTQILLWSMREPARLSEALRGELSAQDSDAYFSVVSIWEIAIKANLENVDFEVDARRARSTLLRDGWQEMAFTGEHAIIAGGLPRMHGDPFDRALIAQARVEGIALLTSDRRLRDYGEPVRLV